MPSEPSNLTPAAARTRQRIFRTFAGLLVAGFAGYLVVFTVVRQQVRSAQFAALRSGDGENAKRAAWWVADFDRKELSPRVREALARPEISDDFRESLIYTLGRLGDREAVPELLKITQRHDNGLLRQAAWVAVARIDADAFRKAADTAQPRDDWDRLGISQGRLHVGDPAGAPEVLRLAAEGDVNQRQIACRSLTRMVRPVLETAGRWPAAFDPRPSDIWEQADVDRIAERVRAVDLAAVAHDTERHVKAAAGVQKNVRRLASGSDHLARLLFWRSRQQAANVER